MAKRATKTRLPAKKSLRTTADKLWSRAVRDDWAGKCAVCGRRETEAHHLIPRTNYATRYSIENGIALCFQHHKSDNAVAPHQNAAGWMEWLEVNHPSRTRWYRDHMWDKFQGIKTQIYFVTMIQDLRQYFEPSDFADIVGPTLLHHLENRD